VNNKMLLLPLTQDLESKAVLKGIVATIPI